MASESPSSRTWYLRMFSYLLIICGAFGFVTGDIVVYQAFVDGGAEEGALPLGAVAIGIAAAVTYGITIAAGILGLTACRRPERLGALYTLALAGLVACVLGLGLCYATGAGMPTVLLFDGVLLVIGAVIAANLRKTPPQDGTSL